MISAPPLHPSCRDLKQQGDKAYASRDFISAVDAYSEALDNVEDAVVLSNRSAAYAQRRFFDKALNDAERALRLQPSWPRLHHRRGHALFHLCRYSDAIDAFEAGLKLDPEDSLLKEGIAKIPEFTMPAESEDVGEKRPLSQSSAPDVREPKSSAVSSESTAEATSKPSRRPGAFSSRTTGTSGTSASATSSGADVEKPSADELREKGNGFFRAGKFSAAIRAYDEAIRTDGSDARCWANRAASQMSMLAEFGKGMPPEKLRGNPYYNNSLSDLEKALSLDSKYAKAWARKGQLHFMVGEWQQASNAYERGLLVDPNSAECLAGRQACKVT